MNPDLLSHPEELLRGYAMATPAARLRAIKQRLASAAAEMGPTRLVTLVGAVEALARSLVVHAPGRPTGTAHIRFQQFRGVGPVPLVEEVLRLRGAPRASLHFGRDDWELFEVATHYRDLVVHECTYLGDDRVPFLIEASEAVLRGLVALTGLEARPKAVA